LVRGNSSQRERIRRGIKASKQVKLTERSEFTVRAQGNREAGNQVCGKGAHSRWGNQATA